ncbi:MAG: hypothetical protein LBG88_01210 [Christensenellaceae bacterium]|nr:hypothetical protein [Christensenellaceae bacterium]
MKIYRVLHEAELVKLKEEGTLNTGHEIQSFDDDSLFGDKNVYSGKDIKKDLANGKYFFFSLPEAIHYVQMYNRGEDDKQTTDYSIFCTDVSVETAKENLTGDYYSIGFAATAAAETVIAPDIIDAKIRKGEYEIIESKEHKEEFGKIANDYFDNFLSNKRPENEKKLADIGLDIRRGRTFSKKPTKRGENPEFDKKVNEVLESL